MRELEKQLEEIEGLVDDLRDACVRAFDESDAFLLKAEREIRDMQKEAAVIDGFFGDLYLDVSRQLASAEKLLMLPQKAGSAA